MRSPVQLTSPYSPLPCSNMSALLPQGDMKFPLLGAQRFEAGAHFLREELRLFPGGIVAAFIDRCALPNCAALHNFRAPETLALKF